MSTPTFGLHGSRQAVSWMREIRASIAFSTYQSGKVFLLGVKEDGSFSVFERTFERAMGLAASADSQTLWLGTLWQLWRFENAIPRGQAANGFDRLYVPQCAYTTGDVDIHDIALVWGEDAETRGHGDAETADSPRLPISVSPRLSSPRPIFVNTLFSCIAAPSETYSFRPVWRPPWITRLAAEDRCHLNGLAIRDGAPAFVTAVSTTDVHEGWREHRRDGGVVCDVASNEIVARGLSMPHSPRWHDGTLYVLNSGAGEFGRVDLAAGKFEPIAFCPGYARGLAIVGHYAVIGLSACRENRTLSGLPLDDALAKQGVSARCGLQVVDLRTGDVAHSITIEGVVRELYDVAVLNGAIRPSALGFKTDEIRRTITIEE